MLRGTFEEIAPVEFSLNATKPLYIVVVRVCVFVVSLGAGESGKSTIVKQMK